MREVNTKSSMGWKLTVSVGRTGTWDLRAKVVYKWEIFILPADLNSLFNNIYRKLNYKRDVAEVVYQRIEEEVLDMVEEYTSEEVEKFRFPEIPTDYIRMTDWYYWRYVQERPYQIWDPYRIWDSDFAPYPNEQIYFLRSEDYEELKRRGELRKDILYCILNN